MYASIMASTPDLVLVYIGFNEIRKAAKKEQVTLADLAILPVRYETLVGSHPTVNGHSTIAEAWIGCLKPLFNHI